MKILENVKRWFSKREPKVGELWMCEGMTSHEEVFEVTEIRGGYLFYVYPFLSNRFQHSITVDAVKSCCIFVARSREEWKSVEQ